MANQNHTGNRHGAPRRRFSIGATALIGAAVVMIPAVSQAGVAEVFHAMNLPGLAANIGRRAADGAIYRSTHETGVYQATTMDRYGITGAVTAAANNAVGQIVRGAVTGAQGDQQAGGNMPNGLPPATRYMP